jgi:hypothetical protein
MRGRKLTRLGLVVGVLCLMASPAAWGQSENIGGATLTNLTPDPIAPDPAVRMCFTVNAISPDLEYMDRFDVDLPDNWIVLSVDPDSTPVAQGCASALPPVAGVEAGNVVYWQSTGYPPVTGCGAWNGGTGGTDFELCIDVEVPDCTGAPWSFPWNVIGDGWAAVPHTAAGTYGPVDCAGTPGDTCDTALQLSCPGGGGASSVLGSTVAANFTNQGTCTTSHTAPDMWYTVTGNGGQMTATTCSALTNYDTKVTVWSGACAAPVCVDGNDDDFTCTFNTLQSTVTWPSVVGETYYIMVHGFSSNTGDFELTLDCAVPVELMSLSVE